MNKILLTILFLILFSACQCPISTVQNTKNPKKLKVYLKSKYSWKKEAAIESVGKYIVKELVDQVIALALNKNEFWWVRASAVTTLAKLELEKSIPALIKIAENDSNINIRLRAIEALSKFKKTHVSDFLRLLLKKENTKIIQYAVIAALDRENENDKRE